MSNYLKACRILGTVSGAFIGYAIKLNEYGAIGLVVSMGAVVIFVWSRIPDQNWGDA